MDVGCGTDGMLDVGDRDGAGGRGFCLVLVRC